MVRAESKWKFFFFFLFLIDIVSYFVTYLFFFPYHSKAFCRSWSCWNHRVKSRSSAAWLCTCNYHGSGRGNLYLSCGNVNSHCFLLVLWISLVFSCVLKLFTWELDHYFQFKFHILHGFWKIQLLIQFTCSETCRLSTLHKVDFLFS